ncbi:MAG: AAA family ATPase [Candidatus Dependentiae bacterium]|nr:AAA family ATPase [Candidatus Dependentiae bacterium]
MKGKLLLMLGCICFLAPIAICAEREDGEDYEALIGVNLSQDGLRIDVDARVVNAMLFSWLALQKRVHELQGSSRANIDQLARALRSTIHADNERDFDGGSGMGSPDDGESGVRFKPVTNVTTKFSDVGGAHAAKRNLVELVDFLKNPGKYEELGARVPHGVLLTGEPGTGKTLLARAVAGEANRPFFSVKGSEFVELYVGAGALHVRELFEEARKCAPCIVFIDEIDAIGAARAAQLNAGDREQAQTLNQLLTEMDGFEKTSVIVIGATNRADMLDAALLRPGRFDRKVEVALPDHVERIEILKAHLPKVKTAADLDIETLARCTPGFSGAALANLVNEAALHAVQRRAASVAMEDFDVAHDKIVMGEQNETLTRKMSELRETAYHEAGHALVVLLLPELTEPLYKVTIESRGQALGFAGTLPDGDRTSWNREELLAQIMICLAGRIGEEFGTGKWLAGVSSDLERATNIARKMVCVYGMSELGLVAQSGGKDNEKINAEIRKIINGCETRTRALLMENRAKLDKLAGELLVKKTLTAAEVYALLDITPRTMHVICGAR